MSMYCNQCQEAVKNVACTAKGVCGKDDAVSNLQDLLIYHLQGIAILVQAMSQQAVSSRYDAFVANALFATITNANFDQAQIHALINQAIEIKAVLRAELPGVNFPDQVMASETALSDQLIKAAKVGILTYSTNEDIRSLKAIMLYGLKGVAAYYSHAIVLGATDRDVASFMMAALVAIVDELSLEDAIQLVMKTGEIAVKAMALLDQANTGAYGNPVITQVDIGVGNRPGILISGHDLKDMEDLLIQTDGSGVDVYTHSEMLPAHYYPAFQKFTHLRGNYGGSWWQQDRDFDTFNGPILMTTNCIVPVKKAYSHRIFTTGMAGYPGVPHIESNGGKKDFSAIIELAKTCKQPQSIEDGKIVGGFAHHQLTAVADQVVQAVQAGKISRFVVMAGCDGRQAGRQYFTDVAQQLPGDAVILTAGCAKYRYNKLNLGDIGGIPRVIDAGQCNDSYSLALIALKLKEIFQVQDVNDLPISFDIAWYEQKAVAVLLALLFLGFKHIRLGPTLPAFVSKGVLDVLVSQFDLKPIGSAEEDVREMVG